MKCSLLLKACCLLALGALTTAPIASAAPGRGDTAAEVSCSNETPDLLENLGELPIEDQAVVDRAQTLGLLAVDPDGDTVACGIWYDSNGDGVQNGNERSYKFYGLTTILRNNLKKDQFHCVNNFCTAGNGGQGECKLEHNLFNSRCACDGSSCRK